MQSHTKWRGIKRSFKKIGHKMEEINKLFFDLSGEYLKVVVLLILQYIDPVDTYLNLHWRMLLLICQKRKNFTFLSLIDTLTVN